jgi:hypothetical protein
VVKISAFIRPAPALLLVLAALPAAIARAQDASLSGRLVDPLFRRAVASDVAAAQCPRLGDETYGPDIHQIGTCEPLGLHDLGVADSREWVYGSYKRRWLFAPQDTVSEIELVLFTARYASAKPARRESRSRSLVPVWHAVYEPETYRSVTPDVVRAPTGGVLIAIDACFNGTGGCAQSFALYGDRGVRVVAMQFLDSLNRRFPDGIRHGYHVDVRTLRAEAAVYSDGDGNCCPSRVAEMQLRLRGSNLELTELVLRPLKP